MMRRTVDNSSTETTIVVQSSWMLERLRVTSPLVTIPWMAPELSYTDCFLTSCFRYVLPWRYYLVNLTPKERKKARKRTSSLEDPRKLATPLGGSYARQSTRQLVQVRDLNSSTGLLVEDSRRRMRNDILREYVETNKKLRYERTNMRISSRAARQWVVCHHRTWWTVGPGMRSIGR
ncbi:hypothetical protein LIA77_00824 [Sarocladium implicatum]|nr:hypothetical protein LIA77_00824 [Sarocladium implicatum]